MISALIASVWTSAIVRPAWSEIPGFVFLPVSSAVTSALLLIRFEFGDAGSEKRAAMFRAAKETRSLCELR